MRDGTVLYSWVASEHDHRVPLDTPAVSCTPLTDDCSRIARIINCVLPHCDQLFWYTNSHCVPSKFCLRL